MSTRSVKSRERAVALVAFALAIAAALAGRASLARTAGDDPGLELTISEPSPGEGRDEAPAKRPPLAPASPLGAAEAATFLERAAPIAGSPADDAQAFRLPEATLPAPRPGETHEVAFPPKAGGSVEAPPEVARGPLEVVRFSPDGEVELAPNLSVTFSQPMVPLSSHGELEARDVPVRLRPEVTGSWRWVGTKTVVFTPRAGARDGGIAPGAGAAGPATRLPMATRYEVEVVGGARSVVGGELAAKVAWSFATPAPRVARFHPAGGPQVRDPLMFAAFDQRIVPEDVLATIRLRADGADAQVRLATREEVEADPVVSGLARTAAESVAPGRGVAWLAFRATSPLAADAKVVVKIGPGTPSAEGPRTTGSVAEFVFHTYPPLRIEETAASRGEELRPGTSLWFRFNNPLDPKQSLAEVVRVRPDLGRLSLSTSGAILVASGMTRPRTTYEVTLLPGLADSFGQTLGRDETVRFHVGKAPPTLGAPGGPLAVLDPAAGPRFSVFTVNHDGLRVRAYAVEPKDFGAYLAYLKEDRRSPGEPPGEEVIDRRIDIEASDEMLETRIDLSEALKGGLGQLVVVVEPRKQPYREPWRRQVVRAWVQATRIGLAAFADDTDLVAWATNLADGRPLEGAALSIEPDGVTGRTGADGLAALALAQVRGARDKTVPVLVARSGEDVAILPAHVSPWGAGGLWRQNPGRDALAWYVIDDRGIYRPGEKVSVKGWVRRLDPREGGTVGAPGGEIDRLAWKVFDARRAEIAKGEVALGDLGGFDLAFSIPAGANLGPGALELTAAEAGQIDGKIHRHAVRIAEFRRPEYEVTVSAERAGPYFVLDQADVRVSARYYAGGPLPDAEVLWRVSQQPGQFRPPNFPDFWFGDADPWWWSGEVGFGGRWGAQGNEKAQTFPGRTDAQGAHALRLAFDAATPPRPVSLRAEATVTDVNRQAWAGAVELLVHPADTYVGMKRGRSFVGAGEPVQIEVVASDLDGRALAGVPVTLTAVRLVWAFEEGTWRQREEPAASAVVSTGERPVAWSFKPDEGGTYRVSAEVRDARGRRNRSRVIVYVSGGQAVPSRGVDEERAGVIADRETYGAGDTAELLVQAPFFPAEGLLTLRRSGIVTTERFRMDGPTHTLRVKILEEHVPNVHVQVDLAGAAARDPAAKPATGGGAAEKTPRRPAYAKGSVNLRVPPVKRTLAVEVAPREREIEPGGATEVKVAVRDSAGAAVAGSEVALLVVDEAVLALTSYKLLDPLAVFFPMRPEGATDRHSRAHVVLARAEDLIAYEQERQGGGAQSSADSTAPAPASEIRGALERAEKGGGPAGSFAGEGVGGEPAIRVREDMSALAAFVPSVRTGEDGTVTVPVKLPDSLTRYRIMAVAVEGGDRFGSAESTLTARLPLMVRPQAPRFLRFGDEFELAVVLQNQTERPLEVALAFRTANLEVKGEGLRASVPARDRVEVRVLAAARRPGTARVQVVAAAVERPEWTDAAVVSLPVYTPATTEAFATYGEIDEGAEAHLVVPPQDAVHEFGGLEVTLASTALESLTDAVLYLAEYPFECAEQISSRILAIAALRDVLSAFKAEGLPKEEELVLAVGRDLERLRSLQEADGGFGFWRRGGKTWPYVSIHAAHALERARAKGFKVPPDMVERSSRYLREIEAKIDPDTPLEVRRTLVAYALHVRERLGDRDVSAARRLVREAGVVALSLEALGWILPVLTGDSSAASEVDAIRRHLRNRVTETAAAATFTSRYSDGAHLLLHSERRADAVILEALIRDDPGSDIIPKIVRGLMGHRKRGHWGNTQENAFVLLALDRYFRTYEREKPEFVARLWLGERFAGEGSFAGRSADREHLAVPMAALHTLLAPEGGKLVLAKEGRGRLYYRLGMRYAPRDLALDPADHGFFVERSYEAIDRPEDVRRDEKGTWHIRSGARVRVRLTMVAPSRRHHVALVDPLPAGLEPLDAALAVTGALPDDPKEKDPARGPRGRGCFFWWWGPWYEHQNLRDDRVEAFASLLAADVHEYGYVARATTPGAFVAPPPKAEEMYNPETFGRGRSERVVVE